MHSTATAIPTGPSQNREHCFALTSSSGEINIFQAGTDELVVEWITACNYWAARRSRQPLQGGVGNIEYGWNRAVSSSDHKEEEDRASVKSGKSGLSRIGGYRRTGGAAGVMDKVHLNEWKAPALATLASPLDEESQLDALGAYLGTLRDELSEHKAIEKPMMELVRFHPW
jgi:PH/SEC7 domain-containing protein